MKDQNLLELIKSGSYQVLGDLYERYRDECIRWLVSKYQCNPEEAKDIYQNSIIVLYENIIQNKLTDLQSGIKTYLYAIAKNKMKESTRRQSKQTVLDKRVITNPVTNEDNPETPDNTQLEALKISLEHLGEPCINILKMFYYQKMNISEIKKAMNYKSKASAKNQKYKCLQRLRRKYREFKTDLSI